jgi:hypothetical protein
MAYGQRPGQDGEQGQGRGNLGRVTRAGAIRTGAIRASAHDSRGGGRAASFRSAS